MILVGITAYMGALLLVVGAAAGLFAVGGFMTGAPETPGFAASALFGLFLGGSLWLTTRGRRFLGGVREALAFVLLGWVSMPAIAAAPFFVAAPDHGVSRAYLDAVSAATTTGLPPAIAGETGHALLVLWWNLLQWAGGAASIIGALVVLASLNLAGPGVHRSALFTLESDEVFARIGRVTRSVMPVYAGATVIVWLAIWIAGVTPDAALCVAMAAISTGGLWLPSGEISAADLPMGAVVAAGCGLLFGVTSFVLHWDAARGRPWRAYLESDENRGMLAVLLIALTAVALEGGRDSAGEGPRSGFEALSVAATAGWDFGGMGLAAMSAPIVMAVVFIGGAPVSTAGGIKVVRVLLLLRHAGGELRRLAHPSSVGQLHYRDLPLPHRTIMVLLLHVIGYLVMVTVVTLIIATQADVFEHALAAAVAALANVGPILAYAGPEGAAAILDDPTSSWTLCAGMILGRVDVIAALAVFTPAFWRG